MNSLHVIAGVFLMIALIFCLPTGNPNPSTQQVEAATWILIWHYGFGLSALIAAEVVRNLKEKP
jgi:heme A synthase